MNRTKKQEQILIAGAAILIVVYCFMILGFVVTSPDLRLRCLLSDSPADTENSYLGSEIRKTTGLECKGVHPEPGDILLRIGETRIKSFIDFTCALNDLRHAPVPPGGQLDPGADPSELGGLLPSLVEVESGQRLVEIEFWRKGWESPQSSWLFIQSLPAGEVFLSFLWLFLQLGIFIVSTLSVWHRPFDRPARLFFAMCIVTLGAFIGGFHWWVISSNVWLNIPFVICAILVPAVSLHFFLVYPSPKQIVSQFRRFMLPGIYMIPTIASAGIIFNLVYSHWLNSGIPSAAEINTIQQLLLMLRQGIYNYFFFAAVCFVLMIVALAHTYSTTKNPIEHSQMKWMLWAGMIATIPVGYTLWLALYDRVEFALGSGRIPMFLASLSFMLAYAVCIIRFKLMLIDQIVTKGMLYYAVSSLLTVLFGMMVASGSIAVNYLNQSALTQMAIQQAISVAVLLMLITVFMLWLRDRFQQLIDRRFYREKYQLDKALQRMNRAVGHLVDRQSLAERMLTSCRDVLGIESASLYMRDPGSENFQLIAAEGTENVPLQFAAEEELLEAFQHDAALQLNRPGMKSEASQLQAIFQLLNAELLYALELDDEPTALAVLGNKTNGSAYTAEDLTFLNALGQITSVALHSAKVHRDMTRLSEELQLKVNKIEEQSHQITMLQSELTGNQSPRLIPSPQEFHREPIRGNSPAIRGVLDSVRKVANSESSVIIRGESGTGKELIAQAIHENSPRRNGPMIRVHCAALSPSLLESELFGHVKGAFTGAHRDRVGRFEMASGGTLFLDEIGDVSLETQIKLLRVLQERSFEPVGGTKTTQVDVRLITATHQNLEKLISAGGFREDLFYRLNVISIALPALRERPEDIFELAIHFLQRAAQRTGKRITHIDDNAVDALKRYHWPGNIRELENMIERAVVLADNENLSLEDLPIEIHTTETSSTYVPELPQPRRLSQASAASATISKNVQQEDLQRIIETKPASSSISEFRTEIEHPEPSERKLAEQTSEYHALINALHECGGNKAEAARMLGMPRSTYYSKLKKHDIK